MGAFPISARGRCGAGLGLSIATWVTEAHGGSLALVRSSPDGSAFRVTLPIREASEAPSTSPSARS